jgi:hypothetical protein
MFGDQDFFAVFHRELLGLVLGQHRDAFGAKSVGHEFRHLRVFPDQDARPHFDLRDLTAETGEGLGQFRTDGAAAQHHQPFGQLAQIPNGVRGEIADLLQSRNRRDERPRAGGDDDARVVSVRVPVGVVTSTVQGEVIFAAPSITSTPRPVYRSTESCGATSRITRCTRSITSAKSNSASAWRMPNSPSAGYARAA